MSGIATAIIGGVGLLYSGYKGIKASQEEKKAKQEANALTHPFYKVADEYYQNRNIAEQQASGGLPQGVKDNLDINRKQGLNSSLEALQQVGGGAGGFESLLKGYNDSIGKEASADSEAHINNIQYFMQANKDIAGQKNTGFGLNELQPYENKIKEITERRAAAKINEDNAIQEGLGSLGSIAGSFSSNNYMQKLFGKQDPYQSGGGATFSPDATGGQWSGVTNFADTYGKLDATAPSLSFAGQEENDIPTEFE